MMAILDVDYGQARAAAACLAFERWADRSPHEVFRVVMPIPAAYRAGRFFERELPCLRAVLEQAGQAFEKIVIDGYVHLKTEAGLGLGAHLRQSLAYPSVVIGVAKTPLTIAHRFVPLCRGRSRKPLFISAIGCPAEQAAQFIFRMHGPHRIPTLLKWVDHYARTGRPPVPNRCRSIDPAT
jgi:deoxyribonuclease V